MFHTDLHAQDNRSHGQRMYSIATTHRTCEQSCPSCPRTSQRTYLATNPTKKRQVVTTGASCLGTRPSSTHVSKTRFELRAAVLICVWFRAMYANSGASNSNRTVFQRTYTLANLGAICQVSNLSASCPPCQSCWKGYYHSERVLSRRKLLTFCPTAAAMIYLFLFKLRS